ncbi:threonylcarbamoyladenosine tRNA methylthiotransferase [Archaeoglobales archaeon]|nr:MAG: threonylcarbamoyladenosine tRNA methylthiotransferase [Archaeoglobales archaeon]
MNIYIETYGCTMNQSDSDIMRGVLSKEFRLSDLENANVVVINSCGVIEYTERKIIKRILELKKRGKKVVLAGCLPRIARKKVESLVDAMVSPDNVHLIDKAVKAVLSGERPILIQKRNVDKAEMYSLKCRLNYNAIAIVSISEGCVGSCSFCITKAARGRLRSFSLEKIVEEVGEVVRSGFKEIQLTSQDTAAYGLDKDLSLPDLLNALCKVEGDFRIRVGMMNPQHAVKILDDLINAFSNEKIYKFIHVPVQSGDNKVLEDMRRNHTVEDFVEVVSAFRKNFEDVLVSTDIIVGFPTENEESFWKSYELIKEIKPDIVNITRYSPRKGTQAYRLKNMPDWIKKERSRKLTNLMREIGLENNKKFVGGKFKVLITKKGKNNTLLSRTNSYRAVVLDNGYIGEFKNVLIEDFRFNYLVGRSVDSKVTIKL